MNIYSLTIPSGADVFYSKGFMDALEAHMGYFRTSPKSGSVQVNPKKAYIYNGDLFGYLNEVGIPQKYHWLIMRINYFYDSFAFGPDTNTLIVPDTTEIEQIRSSYLSTGAITL